MCYGCVPVGGTVALYLLLRFVFDTYIASNAKELFFLHCIFLLPIKPVFPMFDSILPAVRLQTDSRKYPVKATGKTKRQKAKMSERSRRILLKRKSNG